MADKLFTTEFNEDNTMKNDMTVIGTSTIIEAIEENAIKCGGDIEIRGKVKGIVTVSGNADIYGTVEGNIEANQLNLQSGSQVKGDINCQNSLKVEDGSAVEGNLKAKSAYINSNVLGNIETSGDVRIDSSSIINGNITTSSINVESGAVINGQLAIKKQ